MKWVGWWGLRLVVFAIAALFVVGHVYDFVAPNPRGAILYLVIVVVLPVLAYVFYAMGKASVGKASVDRGALNICKEHSLAFFSKDGCPECYRDYI